MMQVEKFPISDFAHNSMEEWLRFLNVLLQSKETDSTDEPEKAENENELGLERASIANSFDSLDTRFYGRFIEPERLTDTYVDCAEFVYDVLKKQGFTDLPSGDCVAQSKWYKEREKEGLCITSTETGKITVGDIILWTGKWEGSKEYAHTGIVVNKTTTLLSIVHAGQKIANAMKEGKQPGKLIKCKLRTTVPDKFEFVQKYNSMQECYDDCTPANYSIYNTSSYFNSTTLNSAHHTFKYWARPTNKKD